MLKKLLLKGAEIVNPRGSFSGLGDVLIANGLIADIGKGLTADGAEVIDCDGLTLMPGFVDMHCHLREPGYEYKETIATGTKAAARGGFTQVACMPNTSPLCDNPAVVKYILDKAEEAGNCRVLPVACITKGQKGQELTEMALLKDAGAIAFSDDGRPVESGHMMNMALRYAKSFDCLLISHCEDLALVNDGVLNEGYTSTVMGLKPSTRAAEEVMVARECILAQATGTRVHIAHVSTRGSVAIIRDFKARGTKVTAETCPHYFSATDELAEGFNTFAKVNPPLRTADDVQAIIGGLMDGTLDALATDHAPHELDSKRVEFQSATNGISGFETAFALAYTNLVKAEKLSLDELIVLLSCTPAGLLGVEGGKLEKGARADIAIADLCATEAVDVKQFSSKGKNTPFDGVVLSGVIRYTLLGGKLTYEQGQN